MPAPLPFRCLLVCGFRLVRPFTPHNAIVTVDATTAFSYSTIGSVGIDPTQGACAGSTVVVVISDYTDAAAPTDFYITFN